MTKYTAGPWKAKFQPEGELVAHWDILTVGGINLACLPYDTQEPDARLISAAPDLLEFALAYVQAVVDERPLYLLTRQATEAIAKALGEQAHVS